MSGFEFIVRVDTKAGLRTTHSFYTLEEANTFALMCEDKVVYGPKRVVHLTEEEGD